MAGRKIFHAANLEIKCDERCPLYYCNDPCRVRDHVERYVRMLERGYKCSALLGGE